MTLLVDRLNHMERSLLMSTVLLALSFPSSPSQQLDETTAWNPISATETFLVRNQFTCVLKKFDAGIWGRG